MISFTPIPTMGHLIGAEQATEGDQILATITPNATGPGGWLTIIDRSPTRKGFPALRWVPSRKEAREIVMRECAVPSTNRTTCEA